MGGLQLSGTVTSAFAVVFIFNFYRAWLYSNAAVYIKVKFPVHYFGRLMGIVRITMGLLSLLLIGLAEISKVWPSEGFDAIFITFIITMVIGFAFPIHGFIITNKTI